LASYLKSSVFFAQRCTRKTNPRIHITKTTFNKNKDLFTSKLEENGKGLLLEHSFCGTENWTLQEVDLKYLERFEMWCCRKKEISWTDRVRNEEVLLRVKKERNILHEIRKRKANWIGHILRRNLLIKYVIEEKWKE
jgi:hypothetical protein